jgi:hypothetical protein
MRRTTVFIKHATVCRPVMIATFVTGARMLVMRFTAAPRMPPRRLPRTEVEAAFFTAETAALLYAFLFEAYTGEAFCAPW